jgi:hypothetical protein
MSEGRLKGVPGLTCFTNFPLLEKIFTWSSNVEATVTSFVVEDAHTNGHGQGGLATLSLRSCWYLHGDIFHHTPSTRQQQEVCFWLLLRTVIPDMRQYVRLAWLAGELGNN